MLTLFSIRKTTRFLLSTPSFVTANGTGAPSTNTVSDAAAASLAISGATIVPSARCEGGPISRLGATCAAAPRGITTSSSTITAQAAISSEPRRLSGGIRASPLCVASRPG